MVFLFDGCSIPLPHWILEVVEKDPDLVYTDKAGRRNKEYISLGCDTLPLLKGRTPIQVYADYMRSFRDEFSDKFGKIIVVYDHLIISPINCNVDFL